MCTWPRDESEVCAPRQYPLFLQSNVTISETILTATNDPTRTPGLLATPQKVAFAALKHPHFRGFFFTTMLAMMADNIEHVISYWVLFEKFQSPVLGGFAVISHWTPFLFLSVYFGGLADRHDCRRLIQIAQIMYMFVSAAWAYFFSPARKRSGMRASC